MGVTGPGHRRFLAEFYAGRFPGSFARGADFQVNEDTGDARTNGAFASLAGLEAAQTPEEVDLAVARILLGHALIAGFGGLPLIYMGDEIGLLNDHTFRDDPHLAGDGRWMHRPPMDWPVADAAAEADTPAGRIFRGTRHILRVRAETTTLRGDVPSRILATGHDKLFCVRRPGLDATLTTLYNFTAAEQQIEAHRVGLDAGALPLDLLAGAAPAREADRIVLPPYAALWLHEPVR